MKSDTLNRFSSQNVGQPILHAVLLASGSGVIDLMELSFQTIYLNVRKQDQVARSAKDKREADPSEGTTIILIVKGLHFTEAAAPGYININDDVRYFIKS